MAEQSNASVCKTDGLSAYVGASPTLPTKNPPEAVGFLLRMNIFKPEPERVGLRKGRWENLGFPVAEIFSFPGQEGREKT